MPTKPRPMSTPWRGSSTRHCGRAIADHGGSSPYGVGEAITLALVAVCERARMAATKRDWPRLRALGVKARLRCACDQCERLRREEAGPPGDPASGV